MKFTIQREELLPALQSVGGVVERRQTLPILSNVLLSVGPKGMRFTATDMEVELVATIDKPLKESAEVTLPARKLLDICRALPEDAAVRLETDGDRATVTSGKSRFTLATLAAREFPLIEMTDCIVEFRLPRADLKALLDQTAFAMAQQDVRYYLNGLLIEVGGGRVRAVATDGHRLALADVMVKTDAASPAQVIVPRKGVMELARLLSEADDEVSVQVTRNHVRVNLGALQFTSKLIDGKFPDYDKVIPPESQSPVLANRESLRQGLIRASILSNEKYRGVRVMLAKNSLRALAHNPDQEEAEEEIEVKYGGEELEIGFNVSYLLDALAIIRTNDVRITMTDPGTSCLILPEPPTACKYVVMPMRL